MLKSSTWRLWSTTRMLISRPTWSTTRTSATDSTRKSGVWRTNLKSPRSECSSWKKSRIRKSKTWNCVCTTKRLTTERRWDSWRWSSTTKTTRSSSSRRSSQWRVESATTWFCREIKSKISATSWEETTSTSWTPSTNMTARKLPNYKP